MQESHLFNRIRVAETPPLIHIRLPHFFTGIAASSLRGDTTITRSTITLLLLPLLLIHKVDLVAQLPTLRVRYNFSRRVESHFRDVVREVALLLATDVCHIQTEHCRVFV